MRRRAAAAREKSAAGGRSNAELRRKLAALERQLQNSDARLKQQQRKFAKLARTLEKRAAVDALTGLYNRQKFDELCAAEIARSRRYGTPLALIMYDIDRFKAVNDAYGHLVGDRVLVSISKLVARRIRESDSIARWGGEEFMILAPHIRTSDALRLAEEIRAAIESTAFAKAGKVTCSFGVTSCKPHDTVELITRRADAALYRAKINGRNRVESG